MKKIIATVLAMVMALALCTTAFAANEPVKGYLKGTNKDANPVEATLTYTPNKDPKTTDGKTAVGTYANYVDSVYSAKWIVVSSLADATAVLYNDQDCKNVVMYLAEIEVDSYVAGKVYNDFADVCGKYDKPASYDSTKTYYTYEKDGKDYLAVAASATAKDADILLTVDGKVVRVDTLDGVTKVKHVAVPTIKDGKVTGYTCSKCKAVAAEAPNFASIPSGANTDGLTGNWYWTTTTTPSTDNKGNTSPKTFDAGIAMYVGMALTSVAGSAVVIGKKKEF